MDDQEKLDRIKRALEQIAAETVRLSEAIERLREELDRLAPRPSNGDE